MKLPAIIKGAAAKLERALADRSKAQAAISELQSKRDALDVEADDYATARRAFDERIAVQEGLLRITADQIARLEAKVVDEERVAAAARRATAIRSVEKLLPGRLEIVAEIEAAVKSIPGLFAKLEAWRAKFIKQYPADVELPFAHFLDDDRVLRQVTAALHAIRIEDAQEAISGLAADEANQHAELIADLLQNPAPKEDIAA